MSYLDLGQITPRGRLALTLQSGEGGTPDPVDTAYADSIVLPTSLVVLGGHVPEMGVRGGQAWSVSAFDVTVDIFTGWSSPAVQANPANMGVIAQLSADLNPTLSLGLMVRKIINSVDNAFDATWYGSVVLPQAVLILPGDTLELGFTIGYRTAELFGFGADQHPAQVGLYGSFLA